MKINLITSSRADFSLLKNLIFEIKKSKTLKLNVTVTGSHFSKILGNSYKEILENKIKIDYKIKVLNNVLSPNNILKDMAKISNKVATILSKSKPDLLIILGDRHEILYAALAAYISKIPIAHIHGGEITEGSLDDGYRHAITKISSLHFTAHESYKKRLIQLGEHPKSIFNVGGLGAENVKKTKLLSKLELEKIFKLKLKKNIITVCVQPEISKDKTKKVIKEILKAIKYEKNKTLIFTMPGADKFNHIIIHEVKKFVKKNKNAYLFSSLGGTNFLSYLKNSDAIIGNSSSGILEMPSLKQATINVGDRQKGRLKAKSIIQVDTNYRLIQKAIKKIYSKKFKSICARSSNPFEKKSPSKKITSILKNIKIQNFKGKKFYDLKNAN
jgi:GDP/UDP-N,N'-diacetylbacillosamine 2-epimerase (hydrolysing)|tara:strand:- start:9303 stop:10460 length:1158 start_codon:yes stop_codon:yes gene_type:complete